MFRGFLSTFNGFGQRSVVDDLLDDEDTTLDQLLAENELINEVKVNNKRLIEFFTRDKIVKLIHYISEMPEENDDNNRTYRYPFVSSEILSCDSPSILDMFFKADLGEETLIPVDNDKPLLLTLKFKKEFLTARRENKIHEESGTIAEPDDDLVELMEGPELDINDLVEPKQGKGPSLDSINAEVQSELPPKTSTSIKLKDALVTKPEQSADQKIDSIQQDIIAAPEEAHAQEVIKDDFESNLETEITDPTIQAVITAQPSEEEKDEVSLHPENQTANDVQGSAKDDEVNLLCEDEQITETTEPTGPTKMSSNYKYELLDLLFAFILKYDAKSSEQINAVLSGYLQKVVLVLLNYKQKEVMNYIYSKEGLMDKLLEHVYDKSICDIIVKVLNISNQTTQTNNNSINNDSGEIFKSPRCNASQREESINYSTNYESSRNEIINKLIDKLIRAKEVEEYWNASAIL
jgi:hypothetical protein